jgi:catalase
VHARGSAAHGYFQVYEPMAEYTKARFLQDPAVKTPVFVRFSTVVGFRGSADTVRDVRGFAVKFYTEDGIYDLVGNNMPVFFIQDAIKFPDLVHAIKPEPHNEMPQASAAHDNFWDFISLMPESMHMIMWVLSDRALPRSYSMMEGFGVHTFRFINEAGKARFVKFHWKPANGIHSLVWDESQTIAGKNPDFNREDLWESIEEGNFPEFELCVQMIEEDEEFAFNFDILDPTKIWPEEMVPMMPVGKMVLEPQSRQFLCRDRAGGVPSGSCSARH